MEELIKKLENLDACEEALKFLQHANDTAKSHEEIFKKCVDEGWVRWFTREISERPVTPLSTDCLCNYCTKLNARRIDPLTLNQILQCLECEWRD